jgi:molecular chaperone DnaK
VVIEQPELVVAEGSILADAALLAAGPSAPGPTAELKLVSSGRAEGPPAKAATAMAPVRTPGGNGLSGGGLHPAGRNGVPQPVHGLRPPVDPWPDADHGWIPDPDATVPTPRDFGAPPVPPKAQAAETQPISPAAPTRGVSPSPKAAGKAAPPATSPKKPPKAAKAPKPPKPRKRPRRFVRFLQILLSILVMIVVPLAALLVAYGWGNGEPIQDDAVDLIKDIADLLGIH